MGDTSHVVMVVDFFLPEPGNRARRMYEIAEELVAEGFKVTVLAPARDGRATDITHGEMRVIRVPPMFRRVYPSMQYQVKSVSSYLGRMARPLLGYIRWVIPAARVAHRLDNKAVLYTPNNPILLHVIGLMVRVKFSRWVVELRDPLVNYEAHRLGAWAFFLPLLESLVVRKSDLVMLRRGLQVSAGELKRRYPHQSTKIRELPDYGIGRKDRMFLSSLKRASKMPERPLYGMYAGNFYARSSPREILDAISEINRDSRRVHVDFFGGWEPDLAAHGNGWDHHGVVPFDVIRDRYRDVDFTIVIGATETGTEHQFLPSKLVELIVAGKPILVLGDGDSLVARKVVEDGYGTACPFSGPGIRQGILNIIAMVEVGRYNEAGRQEFVHSLDIESYGTRFVQAIRDVTRAAVPTRSSGS